VRKDGSRFAGEVCSVRYDADDGPRLWMTVRDLSELRESELRFRALADASFEAVFVHDHGVVLFGNAAAFSMFGVEDIAGRSIFDFISPESADVVRVMSESNNERPYEAMARRADGTTFAVEARGRQVQFQGRSVRIVIARDLSERKKLTAMLAAQDRLVTMGRLAAGVAHEVNNPLTFAMLNLEGVARALGEAWPPEGERPRLLDMLGKVRTGLERVSRVVQDMRAFSRMEPHRPAPIELRRVIDYAASVAGPEVHPRATLSTDVASNLWVLGDEARLGQVFVNLLLNAAHAIEEGRPASNRVEVRARGDGGFVEVEVSDTGSGVPEPVRAHLFEPFRTTKPPGLGVGLGLSICHAIVTSLGGTIAVDPPASSGTTFRVRLVAAAPMDSVAPPQGAAPVVTTRRRVLVVDDEPMLRDVLAQMLRRHWDVVAVGSVDDALAKLGEGAFDAILCDIVMPGRTGVDFHAELGRRFPSAVRRLAFITGGVLDPRIQEFLETSGRPRVYKPFAMAELLRTVETLAAGD